GERQIVIEARAELANETRAHEQLVRDHLCIRGRILQRGNEQPAEPGDRRHGRALYRTRGPASLRAARRLRMAAKELRRGAAARFGPDAAGDGFELVV